MEPGPRSRFDAPLFVIVAIAVVILVVGQPEVLALVELLGSNVLYESDRFAPTYVDRFRITMKVMVDGEERSGTSVNEIVYKPAPRWYVTLGTPPAPGIIGEALCVDLGKRGALVLTFADSSWISYRPLRSPTDILRFPITQIGVANPMPKLPVSAPGSSSISKVFQIPPEDLWQMEYFEYPEDWRSGKLIDPLRLTSVIGGSVTIESVTVESTSQSMSTGIEHCLPWIKNYDLSKAMDFIRGITL